MKFKPSVKILAGIMSATTLLSGVSPSLSAMMSSAPQSQELSPCVLGSDADIHAMIKAKDSRISCGALFDFFCRNPEVGTKRDVNGNTPFDLAMIKEYPSDIVEVCFAFKFPFKKRDDRADVENVARKRMNDWREKWGPLFMAEGFCIVGMPGMPCPIPAINEPIYAVDMLRLYESEDMLNSSEDAIRNRFPLYVFNRVAETMAQTRTHQEISQSPIVKKFIGAVIFGNTGLALGLLPRVAEEIQTPRGKVKRKNGKDFVPMLRSLWRTLQSAFIFTIINNDTTTAKALLDYCQANLTDKDIMVDPHFGRGKVRFTMLSERLADLQRTLSMNETSALYLSHPFTSDKIDLALSKTGQKMLPSAESGKALRGASKRKGRR